MIQYTTLPSNVAITNGSIAQLGEHLPYKQRVIGSSPIVSTKMHDRPQFIGGGYASKGPVVQSVRTLACHARGRGFESHPGRHASFIHHADLAHLVERDLAKVEVAGSSPVIRSKTRTTPIGVVFSRFGADHGGENPPFCLQNGGKNADFAQQTAAFSRRGILLYSPQANYTSPCTSLFPTPFGVVFSRFGADHGGENPRYLSQNSFHKIKKGG